MAALKVHFAQPGIAELLAAVGAHAAASERIETYEAALQAP